MSAREIPGTPVPETDRDGVDGLVGASACKLVRQSKGSGAWFRCEGCSFVWLGTYASEKHRRGQAVEAHRVHLDRISR